jgi:UDP:flavonoid glycosyltransferase YjiC (YdhE family)
MDGVDGSRFLMQELVFPSVRAMHEDLAVIARHADLLVSGELACAAPMVAEQTGLPWAYFALSPISFFSIHDPPVLPGPPGLRFVQSLGPNANRWVRATAKVVSRGWWAPLRKFRRELGLRSIRSPLFEGKYSPQLNLALYSPVIQAPQPDWPAHTVQTGFLFHDEEHLAPELPAAVEDFLRRGLPPIVFTLGSAAVSLAGDFYRESAAAARQLQRRAVLLLGRNPPPPDLPESILAWDYLPYAQIFPRAAALVHQGGIGTTGQALRAGRPMLVVPFAHDQFDNAARVVRLGVGRTLARERYSAATAARELGALLSDPRTSEATVRIGAAVRAEAGVDRACDALEGLLRSKR